MNYAVIMPFFQCDSYQNSLEWPCSKFQSTVWAHVLLILGQQSMEVAGDSRPRYWKARLALWPVDATRWFRGQCYNQTYSNSRDWSLNWYRGLCTELSLLHRGRGYVRVCVYLKRVAALLVWEFNNNASNDAMNDTNNPHTHESYEHGTTLESWNRGNLQ